MSTHQAKILELTRHQGLLRARDLAAHGLPRVALTKLVRDGSLARLSRGLYALPERVVSEHVSLAEVACKCPNVVVCLLSALRFHELTTQIPSEVWLAIPNKAHAPKIDFVKLRIARFSGESWTEGVEQHVLDGVPVTITCIAKTVADCFKYRNKIGMDVAFEALRDAWKAKRVTIDELWHYAKICRVAGVMRPYLEGLAWA